MEPINYKDIKVGDYIKAISKTDNLIEEEWFTTYFKVKKWENKRIWGNEWVDFNMKGAFLYIE